MHGLIGPVTIPRGQAPGQVQPFGPGGGELFEAREFGGVSVPGGKGVGQIKSKFSLILCRTCYFSRAVFARSRGSQDY